MIVIEDHTRLHRGGVGAGLSGPERACENSAPPHANGTRHRGFNF